MLNASIPMQSLQIFADAALSDAANTFESFFAALFHFEIFFFSDDFNF